MKSFKELQAELGRAWAVNRPGTDVDHVVVALPPYSVGESLLAHYATRIPALEHRYLVAHLMLHRIEACELVFLTCQAPGAGILDYYASLVPAARRASVERRFRVVVVPDQTSRSVAAKLLDRPDLVEAVRASYAGRPVLIEPWNVTECEVEVATRLDAPINGTPPDLWQLGYKSAGRRLFAAAGVPAPFGREDVCTVDEVVAVTAAIRAARPAAAGVVIKHDNSGAGDGNAVLDLRRVAPGTAGDEQIRRLVEALPDWYLRDLRTGCVVEELVAGATFSSPSVRVDISPYGDVAVLSTHEQVCDDTGQVYTGCRFPADPAYAADLARYGKAIGEQLAHRGAIGRFSVDFAAALDVSGRRKIFALEINLRKGGTTPPSPYSAISFPGGTTPRPVDGQPPTAPDAGTARPTTSSMRPGSDFPLPRSSSPSPGRARSSTIGREPEWCCTCSRAWPSTVASA